MRHRIPAPRPSCQRVFPASDLWPADAPRFDPGRRSPANDGSAGSDRADETVNQCIPAPAEGTAVRCLVAPPEAGFEILEGDRLCFLANLQAEGVLSRPPPQGRLGTDFLRLLDDSRLRVPPM